MFLQVSVCPRGGACVVAPGGVGVHGCSGGGGMRGCSRGAWLLWGACMVARGACVAAPGGGGLHGFFDEIRSMSGRYASYWNAFLLLEQVTFYVTRPDGQNSVNYYVEH